MSAKLLQTVALGTVGALSGMGSAILTNQAVLKQFASSNTSAPQASGQLASSIIDGTCALGKHVGKVTISAAKELSWKDYLLISGGVYGIWLGKKAGVGGLVVSAAGKLVPGFRKLRSLFGKIEIVSHPSASRENFCLESRKVGSDEVALTPPKCQVLVCEKVDGVYVKNGCAVRFEADFLVGPDHVLGDNGISKYAVGRQNAVCLDGKERIALDTDLVAIKLTAKEMSTIGVSVLKIGPVPSKGLYGQIVGVDSKGTTGVLKQDRSAFGRIVYSGTTLPGYSGAAYTAGSMVYGVHQSGGAVNGGYASGYIWMLLKDHIPSSEVVEFEGRNDDPDSPQWLTGQFNAGKKINWKTTGNPDFVELSMDDGTYSRVRPASMAKAFGPKWTDHHVIEKGFDRSYHDVARESILESVSGESSGAKLPGALSLPERDQESEGASLPSEMIEFAMLSNSRRQDILKSLQLLLKQKPTSNGQVKTTAKKSS